MKIRNWSCIFGLHYDEITKLPRGHALLLVFECKRCGRTKLKYKKLRRRLSKKS